MSLMSTISPEQADGKMKAVYQMFQTKVGSVPKPLELFSISPRLFEYRAGLLAIYGRHPKLSFPLLTLIRYLVAYDSCNNACLIFNGDLIKRQGMTKEDIEELIKNPITAPLEDRECQLLDFVVKALKKPSEINQEHIQNLNNLGWENCDIFEALSYGADMIGPGIMMKVLDLD